MAEKKKGIQNRSRVYERELAFYSRALNEEIQMHI